MKDKEIEKLIKQENKRQNKGLELIASENFASKEVRKAMSTCLTNKYAEGYPNARYYGGCKYIDQIEQLAIDRACKLFRCKYANVQPHSGSQANFAAYEALRRYLKITDRKMKVLSVELNEGGHLTHGSNVSFSSHYYDFSFYHLDALGKIDFDIVEEALKENKPDVILVGYSAYPYEIDFAAFKQLADKYHCLMMVDMAHIAGLVAAEEHTSPFPYADIVTSTTHKTLRGPRGGLILTNNDTLAKHINSSVFPFSQGGPLENIIAAKAICFKEAMQPEFKQYIKQVKANTQLFAETMQYYGVKCSSSDNHLMYINVYDSFSMTGLEAQQYLEEIGITVNKNMIPGDKLSPKYTSGIRIGFAALTTRGVTQEQVHQIASIIFTYLKMHDYIVSNNEIEEYKRQVSQIANTLKRI